MSMKLFLTIMMCLLITNPSIAAPKYQINERLFTKYFDLAKVQDEDLNHIYYYRDLVFTLSDNQIFALVRNITDKKMARIFLLTTIWYLNKNVRDIKISPHFDTISVFGKENSDVTNYLLQ